MARYPIRHAAIGGTECRSRQQYLYSLAPGEYQGNKDTDTHTHTDTQKWKQYASFTPFSWQI